MSIVIRTDGTGSGKVEVTPTPISVKEDTKSAREDTKHESLIDKHSSLSGHYRSTHNLRIQGVVDGEIECQSTLTVDREAKVRAKVMAQNVTVGGILEGEVTCPGLFQILPTGRVVGRVIAGKLEILNGAFYQGELSMHADCGRLPKADGKIGAKAMAGVGDNHIYRPATLSHSDLTTAPKPPAQDGTAA